MKFKDPITGEYKTLHLKTGDTLPVGTIVSFEGDEIPEGYKEVIGEEARVVISPTEPTTGEEVWIDNVNKKIYIKNDNGVYEEFLKVYDLTPKSIPIVLADFVKSGAVEVIRSGNVVVVEVSDVMFKEDRVEWDTAFAYGLPKPFATKSDVWKKGGLTDNKGVIGINDDGSLIVSERTGTQSTSSIYNGQFTYTTTD